MNLIPVMAFAVAQALSVSNKAWVDPCGKENTQARWECEIRSQCKTEDECAWALRVVKCESSFRADVVSRYGYTGLFQWSPYYWNKQYPEDIFDGEAQIKHSLEKYRQGGKNLWECK